MKNIAILGSTGSIGTQALEVLKNLKEYRVFALSTNSNIDLLERQIKEFSPKYICISDEKAYKEFVSRGIFDKVLFGMEGLLEIVSLPQVDFVINSLIGNIGLMPTVKAIESEKDIAIANKETLVTAGPIIMDMVKEKGIEFFPIDSEHSAILQCLQGNEKNKIEKILLTASGGPFRQKSKEELSCVTLEDALKHPNWVMGSKITIDSATLMNKGLEVIEAKHLFGVDLSQIEVVVHPQSIIHSMVMFEDSSVIAQLGTPDMKVPIQYALTYPNRIKNNFDKLDIFSVGNFSFEKPNIECFPCLKYAFDSIEAGGLMPTVMNAANEIAVSRFLKKEISFLTISKIIFDTMNAYNLNIEYNLENIFYVDTWAREYALKIKE